MKKILRWLLLVVLLSGCSGQVPPGPAASPAPVVERTQAAFTSIPATPAQRATPTLPQPTRTLTPTAVAGLGRTGTPSGDSLQALSMGSLAFPIRAAFYYPWFPQAWKQRGIQPFTQYHPALGLYRSDDQKVIQRHISEMQYGKIQLGIASWWGPGHHTDSHVLDLLNAGQAANFFWALYVESEGQSDPTPEAIRSELEFIRTRYAISPAYLKIDDKFLVFVYAQPEDGCGMSDRWKQANTVGAYVVLKVFPGYRNCPSQPDAWHQYAPANAARQYGTDSFTISPGFWKAGEEIPMLARDPATWSKSIQAMVASKANFQLITSFNEWGEGTSVENAQEWASPSGYGIYLDALHNDGAIP